MTKTIAAIVLVVLILIVPSQIAQFTPVGFLNVPIEAILGVGVLLAVRDKARKPVGVALGVLLGLLAVLKLADIGFSMVLDRRFDVVGDWPFLAAGVDFVKESYGTWGAVGAVVLVVVLAVGLLTLTTLSLLRLIPPLERHRGVASRIVGGSAAVWVGLAALGLPIAAHPLFDHVSRIQAGLHDKALFREELKTDPLHDVAPQDLFTALRGKDVMVVYVESYGRVAIEDPLIAPGIGAVLDSGNQSLQAAGFKSRSAFVTSPTSGGGSWLAHDTLLSGLWVNSQQRHADLEASQRMTLNRAFHAAGWRAVGVQPAITKLWTEGAFFGYDQLYIAPDMNYAGPKFTFDSIPDQYTLAFFQQRERGPGHSPVMAEIPLVSSHAPWDPIPPQVGWKDAGNASAYPPEAGSQAMPESVFKRDRTGVRLDYAKSVEYSLTTLVSYVETYGDDNLVVIFLGDHQPAPIVAGAGASRDAPITIIAHDPAVIDRIDSWGWENGIKPDTHAPVWRMDAFRDKFVAAFGPKP